MFEVQTVQKNWDMQSNVSSHRNRSSHFEAPEIVTIDELAMLSDDELTYRYKTLDDVRLRVVDSREETKLWEEELAYVKREQQIRRARREAHERYVKSSGEDFMDHPDNELNFPTVNFDNHRSS